MSVIQLVAGATATTVHCPARFFANPTATVNVTVMSLVPGNGNPQGSVNVSWTAAQHLIFRSAPVAPITPWPPAPFPPPGSGGTYHTVQAAYVPAGITTSAMPWLASSGSCSMAVLQIKTLTVPVNLADALTSSSFNGNAADTSLGYVSNGQYSGNFSNWYQNWYSINLTQGRPTS